MKKDRKSKVRTGLGQSIKGKILVMGGAAILASVILGSVGIVALNKNSRNNEVLKEINRINLSQNENQSLDTSYLYFLEDSYLESIVTNLEEMEKATQTARKVALSPLTDASTAATDASLSRSMLPICRSLLASAAPSMAVRTFKPPIL